MTLTSKNTEEEVAQLLQDLKTNSKPATRLQKLNRLKLLGRDPANCAPIFSKEGIETLAQHGFKEVSDDELCSLEALRCLANALLLHPPTRQLLLDSGAAPKLVQRLSVDDLDGEFLSSRLLFLITYVDSVDFKQLSLGDGLAGAINAALDRHASKPDESTASTAALNETLKLLFNITHFSPSLVANFLVAIPSLVTILHYHASPERLPTPPLQPPISHIINALMNLLSSDDTTTTKVNQTSTTDTTPTLPQLQSSLLYPPPANPSDPPTATAPTADMLALLAASLKAYTPSDLDAPLTPLLLLLRAVHALSPPAARARLRAALLPAAADRALPLGTTDSVPSALLRLSAAPHAPGLREAVPQLLLELCGGDARALVRAVGYGYASGFLVRRGMRVPAEGEEAAAGEDETSEGKVDARDVNYTTGQFRAQERTVDAGPEMTEEEKEREAERLFVLFERLRATGVVDVENPVAAAARSGRFEELDDDEDGE